VNDFWRMRNHTKFQQSINLNSTIHTIKYYIRLLGNASRNSMNSDMGDFVILFFGMKARPKKVLILFKSFGKCLRWDGLNSTHIKLLKVARIILFVMIFLEEFTSFLSTQNSLYVEIVKVILRTVVKRWCVWLECDSLFLCQTFSPHMTVSWSLKGRWRKCMKTCKTIE